MKKLAMAVCILTTTLCGNAFAQTPDNGHELTTLELVSQYQNDAQRIGLDEYSYINAVQRYTQYMYSFSPEKYGEVKGVGDILPMNQLPAFVKVLQGAEITPELVTEWVKQKNINNAKLANFLQIDVKFLDKFEKVYTQAMAAGKTIGKNKTLIESYAAHERIIVEFSCRDVCSGFGADPRDYVELAREADKVKVNGWVKEFVVKFYSKDGQYVKTEIWKKDRRDNIWKERAANCDSDIACHVEP
ncbi:hypothetical protein [Pseudoalteromonas sp. S16_S37]|uniref:hypothetical protein n=1 Tax=Pseudoalteromonas sp. S16_S37 TaxID=2720228 RepID=UPI00168129A9|nr:hypothetical protein [Pseudoalteromonas sp. S16_S37]MBD1583578.1 hypothetical protein [Pseudoalteromonas sp. S16_S37]